MDGYSRWMSARMDFLILSGWTHYGRERNKHGGDDCYFSERFKLEVIQLWRILFTFVSFTEFLENLFHFGGYNLQENLKVSTGFTMDVSIVW